MGGPARVRGFLGVGSQARRPRPAPRKRETESGGGRREGWEGDRARRAARASEPGPEAASTMPGRGPALLTVCCLLGPGFLGTPRGGAEAGESLSRVGQLYCVLERRVNSLETMEESLVRQNVQLVLRGPGPPAPPPPGDAFTFVLQERAPVLLQYVDEDADKLECRLSRYFTENTEILWPGLARHGTWLPIWYTVTISHAQARFTITTFCVQMVESGGQKPVHLSGVFSMRTRASQMQTSLAGTVLLDCAFALDHAASVDVAWVLRQKGGRRREMLRYRGAEKRVTHLDPKAEAFPAAIPRGNVSLLLRNVAVRDQGTYSCSVTAAALQGEVNVEVAVLESPKVKLNVESVNLVEGEERKLVCDVSRYYPLEAQAQWLRQPPAGSRLLPKVVDGTLASSHRQNGDETFSYSSYFLLTGSLRDDGVRYTCHVDHLSLKTPIRKSVTVRVTAKSWSWMWIFIGAILVALSGLLLGLLVHLHRAEAILERRIE
uniref:Ig-like domain-containing protein n=1 Tax=Ornithorhynchus anatinus TaxID=9258 RepID=A0A6I8PAP3_ORNAN